MCHAKTQCTENSLPWYNDDWEFLLHRKNCRIVQLERMKVDLVIFSLWLIFHLINEIDTTAV